MAVRSRLAAERERTKDFDSSISGTGNGKVCCSVPSPPARSGEPCRTRTTPNPQAPSRASRKKLASSVATTHRTTWEPFYRHAQDQNVHTDFAASMRPVGACSAVRLKTPVSLSLLFFLSFRLYFDLRVRNSPLVQSDNHYDICTFTPLNLTFSHRLR